MDERLTPAEAHLPPPGSSIGTATGLDDPRALQILSTEHWSLLSARSLVYNEAFSRAGTFLTFLSASLVSLALVAQAMGFQGEFLLFAVIVLVFDFFIGIVTYLRVLDTTAEDLRAIQGMNRIRHAYVEMAPQVARYLSSSWYDDAYGVFVTYGEAPTHTTAMQRLIHGLTTVNGMVGTTTSAIGGVIAGLLVGFTGQAGLVAIVAGVVGFLVLQTMLGRYEHRTLAAIEGGLEVRFPTPTADS
jgi:hypothetical protein